MEGSPLTMCIMLILLILVIVGAIKLITKGPSNNPTWRGIIISALIGMLPLYLVLCFLGAMGEDRMNN